MTALASIDTLAALGATATAACNRRPDRRGGTIGSAVSTRSARRQRLLAHLHACGPRPVFEALLELEAGRATRCSSATGASPRTSIVRSELTCSRSMP